jgi:flavin-dependent dehydrogenase
MEPLMAGPSDRVSFDAADMIIWDGIVIGAGPAGAMAARQLALGGRQILLVEKKRFPRWKICGACLNGQALAALRSAGLGSLVARLGGIGLKDFQVGFRGRTARIAVPDGASVSRSRLDAALVEAATDAGVGFLQETQAIVGKTIDGMRMVRLTRHGRTIDVNSRVVLVASGLGRIRQENGLIAKTRIQAGSRIGAGCLIANAPVFYGERTIFMAVGREGYVGLVRVEDGSLNLAAAFEPACVRQWGSPARAAAVILAEAGFPSITALESVHWQGTAGLTRRTLPVAEERLFLLGDAAGYVEPFTGEGIAWALATGQAVAPLAAQAMDRWEPQIGRAWSSLHRRLIGRRQLICRAIALMLKRPYLASIGFEILSRSPAAARFVFRRLNAPPSFTNAS